MIYCCPVRSCYITQKFGLNFNNFYAQLGLKGHNGQDYRANNEDFNWPIVGDFGTVLEASDSPTYGKKMVVMFKDKDSGRFYKVYFGHLKDFCVKEGSIVKPGQLLGHTDNSGIYTTGPHLHDGLFECTINGVTMNNGNGYGGAIDHGKFYKNIYIVDYLTNINSQIGIIQKMILKLKELYNLIRK